MADSESARLLLLLESSEDPLDKEIKEWAEDMPSHASHAIIEPGVGNPSHPVTGPDARAVYALVFVVGTLAGLLLSIPIIYSDEDKYLNKYEYEHNGEMLESWRFSSLGTTVLVSCIFGAALLAMLAWYAYRSYNDSTQNTVLFSRCEAAEGTEPVREPLLTSTSFPKVK